MWIHKKVNKKEAQKGLLKSEQYNKLDRQNYYYKIIMITLNSTADFVTVVMAVIDTVTSVAVWDTFSIATGEGIGSTLQCRGFIGRVFHTRLLIGQQLHAIRTPTHPLWVWGREAEVAAVSVWICLPVAEVGTWDGEWTVITQNPTDKFVPRLCSNSGVIRTVNEATDQSESWSWKTWHAWYGWFLFWWSSSPHHRSCAHAQCHPGASQ